MVYALLAFLDMACHLHPGLGQYKSDTGFLPRPHMI